jgi:hypothetical protein
VHATAEDVAEYSGLLLLVETKMERLLFGDYPTGVEVAPAARIRRLRTLSLRAWELRRPYRFVCPICDQNAPETLPPEVHP